MSVKQEFYDVYVSSGQAGVAPDSAVESGRAKLANRNHYLERLLKRTFPADRHIRVLDLGCGHGCLVSILKKHGYTNVAGVDASPEQVALAHRLGVNEVQLGDAREFLDSQTKADVICCFDLIEHLRLEESKALLTRASAVLTPGGLLILHVPNGEGLFGQRIRYGDLTHEICFTPRSIRQLLRPLGFADVQCIEDKPIAHGLTSLVRRVIWDVGTVWARLLLSAETGDRRFVLSQNMLVLATK